MRPVIKAKYVANSPVSVSVALTGKPRAVVRVVMDDRVRVCVFGYFRNWIPEIGKLRITGYS